MKQAHTTHIVESISSHMKVLRTCGYNFLLFCILFVLTGFSTDKNEIVFHTLSVKDGLPQMSVMDIVQDSFGYMWFATRDGLARYDGVEIDTFRSLDNDPESLVDNYVTSLAAGDDGRIYIGTLDGFSIYDPVKDCFSNFMSSSDTLSLSDDKIINLYRDKNDDVWLCTQNGICRFDSRKQIFERFFTSSDNNKNSRFECIVETLRDSVLLVGNSKGLHLFDRKSGALVLIPSLSGMEIRTLHKDKRGNIWVGTVDSGVYLLGNDLQISRHFTQGKGDVSINNNFVRNIDEDQHGNILIATMDGLNIYTPDTGCMESYRAGMKTDNEEGSSSGLSFFSLHSICCDRSNTVWLGSYVGGVNYFNREEAQVSKFRKSLMTSDKKHVITGPIVADRNIFWIGMEGGGLVKYDLENNAISKYNLGLESESNRSEIVNSLFKRGDILWVGLNNGTIVKYDTDAEKSLGFWTIPSQSSIVSLYVDYDNYVYASTYDLHEQCGLMVISPDGSVSTSFKDQNGHKLNFVNISSIVGLEDGSVLLGSNAGGICKYNIHTNSYFSGGSINDMSNNKSLNINHMYRDARGRIWVGTMRHGLLEINADLDVINRFSVSSSIPSNNICGITEDRNGCIWTSTLTSISVINPDKRAVNVFHASEINEFTLRSAATNGRIVVFGGDVGFQIFDSDAIGHSNTFKGIAPVIKSMKVNQKMIPRGVYRYPAHQIKLNPDETSVSFDFRSLDYMGQEQVRYFYKLEGADDDWTEVQQLPHVLYSSLKPGRYVFRTKIVKGTNDSNEVEGESVSFSVRPHFWASTWAFILYFLIIAGFVLILRKWMYEKLKYQNDILLSHQEQERSEAQHQERINLFTNISHELRTPLTLIITPLQDILSKEDIPLKIRNSLIMMRKNTERLLLLVNQLLDFQKQEAGKIRIKVAEGDFATFTEEILLSFRELAESKNITLMCTLQQPKMFIWYDRALMEKTLFNLLTNAIKNMPEKGGEIDVSLKWTGDEKLCVSVADTGIGIAEDQLKHIFDPFYQTNVNNISGTGIGLSLTKGIVELHHGTIDVQSHVGEGTVFTILLPAVKSVFSDDEIDENYKSSENIARYELYTDTTSETPETVSVTKQYSVLVVDDNDDIRAYIGSSLGAEYKIIEASDGEMAIQKAIDKVPDIIICDVMMPVKDGIQVCKTLKEDLRTSHIPIILLTARTTMVQIEEGLKIGADDYITKPFNMEHLRLKVRNLLKVREMMKEKYRKEFVVENISDEPVTSLDDKFLQKLYAVLKDNISNPELDQAFLCREIGMSRTSLFYKIKSLFDESPTEFIRNHRLKMAAQILKEKKLPVSDVAIMVGFNNHSYFSSCFKKLFGCSPMDY